MPGDVLVCMWNDVPVEAGKEKATEFQTKEEQAKRLSTLPNGPNFGDRFSVWGGKGFPEYRKFLKDELIENDTPTPLQNNDLEDTCWAQISDHFRDTKIRAHQSKKLWKVFNRLCDEEEYPPKLSQKTAEWLFEIVGGIFKQNTKKVGRKVKASGLTFQEFQQHWVTHFVKTYSETAVEICTDEIYRWLVVEELKVGWMFRRTKQQANWTPWVKSWFVLTPCRLVFYESPSDKIESGEIILMPGVSVKCLPKIQGVVQEFEQRFHVMDNPKNVLECRVKTTGEQTVWVKAIEDAKWSPNTERTHLQFLLQSISGSNATEAFKSIEDLRNRIPKIATEMESKKDEVSGDKNDNSYDKKFKAAFCKIDTSGNGLIELAEFSDFFKQLGLNMDQEGVKRIFYTIDVDKSGQLSLGEFTNYFTKMVIQDESSSESEDCLRKAFMDADRNKSGSVDFKEFSDFVWEQKRSKRMNKVMEAFSKMAATGKGSITREQFEEIARNCGEKDATDGGCVDPNLGKQLENFFNDVETDEMIECIQDRWDAYTGFKRYDKTGKLVMTGDDEMVADFVPGKYSLVDLACFNDLPPIEPHYREAKVTWKSSTVKGKSGKLIFHEDFDGKIPIDLATNEHLRFYGCSFADTKQTKISLLHRHGIQDFTYDDAYLDDFVLATRGGAGVETHQFSHLDCPMDDDNGVFVLGKLVDGNTIRLTGFRVPQRHTLYLPGGTIHSNDYLKGCWRTMLSDEVIIDHVETVAPKKDSNEFAHVTFDFE